MGARAQETEGGWKGLHRGHGEQVALALPESPPHKTTSSARQPPRHTTTCPPRTLPCVGTSSHTPIDHLPPSSFPSSVSPTPPLPRSPLWPFLHPSNYVLFSSLLRTSSRHFFSALLPSFHLSFHLSRLPSLLPSLLAPRHPSLLHLFPSRAPSPVPFTCSLHPPPRTASLYHVPRTTYTMYRVPCSMYRVPCIMHHVLGIILETISRSGEAGSKEVPLLHLTADTDVEVLVNQVKEEGRKEGRKDGMKGKTPCVWCCGAVVLWCCVV